jgi:hypothetical protein
MSEFMALECLTLNSTTLGFTGIAAKNTEERHFGRVVKALAC